MLSTLDAPLRRTLTELADMPGDISIAAQRAAARIAALPDLLRGVDAPDDQEHYARVLLYASPHGNFTVLALIWFPGNASPIHGHQTWCTFNVHSGELTEITYDPTSVRAGKAVERSRRTLTPGEGSSDFTIGANNHRIVNCSRQKAISVHIYGVPANRVADGVNFVYEITDPSSAAMVFA